jgi:monothiol glutaredoxin
MTDSTAKRIKGIIASDDVVLFMKGVPTAPQCGFSAAAVQVLSQLGVPFKGVDVLSDFEIREGIKAFSNWPTIPQLCCQRRVRGWLRHHPGNVSGGELAALLSDKGIVAAAI